MSLRRKKKQVGWGTTYKFALNVQPDVITDETLLDDGETLVQVSKKGWSWILKSPRGIDIGTAETREAAVADGRACLEQTRKEFP